VNPHDLGLVIIDEEQRFGVGHKEQLKNLRESIDVLTLSATPIPRTMQMSLSVVRDMSLILTPPDERRPVKVHVGEWDPDVVSAAIRYELGRSGQVYYVSNRVRSIDEAVDRVHAAAGEARVGVAHGQMTREELERVMEEFAAGELDVLVATTIIESGIDNPHTNTLIIEDAQRLGLAQMYQLKGRVGRSSTQAFAYFMFPENVPLTEEAMARLTAIDEHQDLGSGMRIAMRDLEIRGAGSMLGAEQSGNMSAVGFDLFAQMLSQAVNDTRERGEASGELPPALSDITVNIPGHAYLPEEYIPDADERVLWYRRIASAPTVADVRAIGEALADGRRGERLRDGFWVVLAGEPNAGKSTLLNALARREAAIVSDVPGTTRDAIEVRLDLDGLPVVLVDTAGLREAHEAVEAEGIRRSRARIAQADLVLALVPPGGHPPDLGGAPALTVHTKADLPGPAPAGLAVSARTGAGLPGLLDALRARAEEGLGAGDALITRARHRDALERCLGHLDRLCAGAGRGMPELAAEDLRLAVRALGEVGGHVGVEDVLDRLFAGFCIGK